MSTRSLLGLVVETLLLGELLLALGARSLGVRPDVVFVNAPLHILAEDEPPRSPGLGVWEMVLGEATTYYFRPPTSLLPTSYLGEGGHLLASDASDLLDKRGMRAMRMKRDLLKVRVTVTPWT